MLSNTCALPETTPADLPSHPEPYWRAFLSSMLTTTVSLCQWLAEIEATLVAAAMDGKQDARRARLENAAVAWSWVFDGAPSTLTLEEACHELDLDPECIRERILATCKGGEDIKLVVSRILNDCRCNYGKSRRKNQPDRGVEPNDWARLRNFRSQNPFGTGIEDFRRLAVGSRQDRDSPRRRTG